MSNVETKQQEGRSQTHVNSVDRAFRILEYLKAKNRPVGISELARELSFPRSSVSRVVGTMESMGYVVRVGEISRYVLGTSTLSLATATDHIATLRQAARPLLLELAKLTKQTVQLGTLFEYEVMYIEQVESTSGLSVVVPSGKPFPVNLSAGGKVLAAHLPTERIKDLLETCQFRANTSKTITDKKQFETELGRVYHQGFAQDDEEFAKGIRCIAAPVLDHMGENIISLGITGHISEITDERFEKLTATVVETAQHLSRKLGYNSKDSEESI